MDLSRLSGRDLALAAALAVAVIVGATLRMQPGVVGVIDDDAVYSVTAKALAEGDGYRLINLPGAPLQTKYPVLYPAAISLAWHAGSSVESSIAAMQMLTIAISSLALAAAFLFIVRFGLAARAPAFAACLLVTTSPNCLFYCCQTVSEMPFLALTVAAWWDAERRLRGADGEASRWRDLGTGVLLGLPFLARTAGIMIPVAAIGVLAWRRRLSREIVLGALLPVVPWLAWMLYGASTKADAIVGYQTDYLGWWRAHFSAEVPVANLLSAFKSFLHIEFEYLARAAYDRVPRASWLLAALGSLPWIVVALRSRTLDLVPVTLVAYFALLIVWPWPPDRFLVPMLPFLGAMLFDAVWRACSRATAAKAAAAIAFALVLVSNAAMVRSYVSASREGGWPYFIWPSLRVDWSNYEKAFAWLREHTGPDDVIASGFDTMTALYTGRAAYRPFDPRPLALFYRVGDSPAGTIEEFERYLAAYRPKYLLLTPMPAYVLEEHVFGLVYGASDERPGLLRPVWQLREDARFVVYEVGAAGGATGSGGER